MWGSPGSTAWQCFTGSAYLEGEYGESDICIGVPCILGKNGIEKVVEFELNAEEKELFAKSAAAVRNTNGALTL